MGKGVGVGNRPRVASVGVLEGQHRLLEGLLDLRGRGEETAQGYRTPGVRDKLASKWWRIT